VETRCWKSHEYVTKPIQLIK